MNHGPFLNTDTDRNGNKEMKYILHISYASFVFVFNWQNVEYTWNIPTHSHDSVWKS